MLLDRNGEDFWDEIGERLIVIDDRSNPDEALSALEPMSLIRARLYELRPIDWLSLIPCRSPASSSLELHRGSTPPSIRTALVTLRLTANTPQK